MPELLRVIHLDHTTALGGAELALMRIVRHCDSWQPQVVLPHGKNTGLGAFDALKQSSVDVFRVGPEQPSGASKAGLLGALLVAAQIGRQVAHLLSDSRVRRAHVIHANTSRSAIYGSVVGFLLRKPVVVQLRDLVDREALGWFGLNAMRFITLPRAAAVIANSQTTAATARQYMPDSSRIHVIHSPIGLSDGQPLKRARRRNTDVFRIGMVARLDPWKGQELLIRAFAKEFAGENVKLQLAGGAPFGHERYQKDLKDLACQLGVAAQVDLLGQVTDVEGFISSMDLCVQASTRPEPLGQNVLQYLKLGKAVVAADCGGPAEWITSGKNGLLFGTNNVDSLARSLRSIQSDPELLNNLAIGAAATEDIHTDHEVSQLHGLVFRAACQNWSG
ncbi:glycosyltransferase family 4 protein [Arthrobacter sp. B0490]|uniref:glycosyltransferase family 4 protein n=1 Tax=Arthrobacter sp. B0490 TaxID=2058891 RepID=UPI000CE2D73C|nr:glycosyltransferase family 4 protein [Arthrobacter sp. B0490]